jgi:hypothetical protein
MQFKRKFKELFDEMRFAKDYQDPTKDRGYEEYNSYKRVLEYPESMAEKQSARSFLNENPAHDPAFNPIDSDTKLDEPDNFPDWNFENASYDEPKRVSDARKEFMANLKKEEGL